MKSIKNKGFLYLIITILPAIEPSLYAQEPVLTDYDLSIPVQIQIDDHSGTGFLLHDSLNFYLITAFHVLVNDSNQVADSVLLVRYYIDNPYFTEPDFLKINLQEIGKNLNCNPNRDIAVIKIGYRNDLISTYRLLDGISFSGESKDLKVSSLNSGEVCFFNNVNIGGKVFILGYPMAIGNNGKFPLDFTRPLVSTGIIAGINAAQQFIIIDGMTFMGNSGSPVLMIENDKVFVIGIIVQFISYQEPAITSFKKIQPAFWSNSGYSIVIPINDIIELANHIK